METVIEVKIKVSNGQGELVEVMSTESKLTKADAGIEGADEHIYIHIQPGSGGKYEASAVSVSFHGKLTKADAGRKN